MEQKAPNNLDHAIDSSEMEDLSWIDSIEYKNAANFFEQIRTKINEILEKDPRIREKLDSIEDSDENIIEAIKSNDFDTLVYEKNSEEYGIILELAGIKNQMIAEAVKFALKNRANELNLEKSEQILLEGSLELGQAIDSMYMKWRNKLYPKSLNEKIKRAKKNTEKYLKNKNLDDPYAIVIEKDGKYENLPYALAFPEEYAVINNKMDGMIANLEQIANEKETTNLISYLKSLKTALNCHESHKENDEWISVKLWKEVDKNWLAYKGRLQIIHNMEKGYERSIDPGLLKVIPEFKILIRYELQPEMGKRIQTMTKENTEELRSLCRSTPSAIKSLDGYENSSVEVAGIIFGGGNSMENIGVAQVGPNYPDVVQKYGCKSFVGYADLFDSEELRNTVAETVFENPEDLQHIDGDQSVLDYIIEFIGSHEIGHTYLGMDSMLGTLEEAKATWTGLIGLYEREQKGLIPKGISKKALKAHIKYCIKYLAEKDDDDYKKEGIANTRLFFESGVIENKGNKCRFNPEQTDNTYKIIEETLLKVRDLYIKSQQSEEEKQEYNDYIENLTQTTSEVSDIAKLAKKGLIAYNKKKKSNH